MEQLLTQKTLIIETRANDKLTTGFYYKWAMIFYYRYYIIVIVTIHLSEDVMDMISTVF